MKIYWIAENELGFYSTLNFLLFSSRDARDAYIEKVKASRHYCETGHTIRACSERDAKAEYRIRYKGPRPFSGECWVVNRVDFWADDRDQYDTPAGYIGYLGVGYSGRHCEISLTKIKEEK